MRTVLENSGVSETSARPRIKVSDLEGHEKRSLTPTKVLEARGVKKSDKGKQNSNAEKSII